jgi:hypothetical protein
MYSLTNTGRTVSTTSNGCVKGMAKVVATEGKLTTEVIVPVKAAREHMARLYTAGWR